VQMPEMPAPMITTAVSAWFLLPTRTSGQGREPGIVFELGRFVTLFGIGIR
jgi:hypothetical protein